MSIKALFSGSVPPDVYRFTAHTRATNVQAAVEAHGWRYFYLDGHTINDKASFLQACAQAMQFPAYFGHNWDALYDCLSDMNDGAAGYVLLYDAVAHFAANDPDEWATAYAVFKDTVAAFQAQHTPLYILLRGTAGIVRDAPKL